MGTFSLSAFPPHDVAAPGVGTARINPKPCTQQLQDAPLQLFREGMAAWQSPAHRGREQGGKVIA